jgi:hypothetical protein
MGKRTAANQNWEGQEIWTMKEKRTVNATAFGKHMVKNIRRRDPNENKSFPRSVQNHAT